MHASQFGDAPEAGKASQSSDSSRTPAPSIATGPTYAEGVIEKKVGEPAGLNCPDDPNKSCDLNFTVTAIQQSAPCDAAAQPPGPPPTIRTSVFIILGIRI